MNKSSLIAEISHESGLNKLDSEKAVNAFIKVVSESLKNGDDVRLIGFGSFVTVHRKATVGRNPKTREVIDIPASISPRFKAGKQLKDIVNNRT